MATQLSLGRSSSKKGARRLVLIDQNPDLTKIRMAVLERVPGISYMYMDSYAAFKLLSRWLEKRESAFHENESPVELVVVQALEWNEALKFSKKLREINPNSKIILLTSFRVPIENEKVFDHILLKPVSVEALASVIETTLV